MRYANNWKSLNKPKQNKTTTKRQHISISVVGFVSLGRLN